MMPPWVRLIVSMENDTRDAFEVYKNMVLDNMCTSISMGPYQQSTIKATLKRGRKGKYKKQVSNPGVFNADVQNVLEATATNVTSNNKAVTTKEVLKR